MNITPNELAQIDRAAEQREHHAAFIAAHPEYVRAFPASAERIERLHPATEAAVAKAREFAQ